MKLLGNNVVVVVIIFDIGATRRLLEVRGRRSIWLLAAVNVKA
jgi:hypothetical protein